MNAQHEMSLAEIVATLHPEHRARQQYEAIARDAAAKPEGADVRCTELGGVTDYAFAKPEGGEETPVIAFNEKSVGVVADHLKSLGWAAGGDDEDFFMDVKAAMENAATPPPSSTAPEGVFRLKDDHGATLDSFRGLHPDTLALVRRFAYALACKLSVAEQKYGYSDGWMRDDWMDECRQKLVEHVAKGDPRDVAAYCAFLWHHEESTTPAQPASTAPEGWKLVPVEPTPEMVAAAHKVWSDHEAERVSRAGYAGSLTHANWAENYYRAMLNAAPAQPAVQGEREAACAIDGCNSRREPGDYLCADHDRQRDEWQQEHYNGGF